MSSDRHLGLYIPDDDCVHALYSLGQRNDRYLTVNCHTFDNCVGAVCAIQSTLCWTARDRILHEILYERACLLVLTEGADRQPANVIISYSYLNYSISDFSITWSKFVSYCFRSAEFWYSNEQVCQNNLGTGPRRGGLYGQRGAALRRSMHSWICKLPVCGGSGCHRSTGSNSLLLAFEF